MAVLTQTNLAALAAFRGLEFATDLFTTSTRNLATGLRVNSPGDDPGSFAMSERLKARLSSLQRLENDNQVSLSLVQTAEGGLENILSDLQTIRTLALSSASSSATTADRNANQTQYSSLQKDITSIANNTIFNAKSLLSGDYAAGTATLKFQVGADANNFITLNIATMTAAALGVDNLDLTTQTGATAALALVDSAINIVTNESANVGATDTRLQNNDTFLNSQADAHTQAISGLIDADVAQETINLARAQVLQQTSSSALSQANLYPQNVLAVILPSNR
ncbi:MAG: hypothetical protein D6679_02785 [Candidatus Hydrogenedentota bacterium]|nr:MAG: hypothetical protein D6679_02785 [Candidatus Hydrogenedentota bacterium]